MQEIDVELEAKEKKYLRGEGANLEVMICCFFFGLWNAEVECFSSCSADVER